MPSPSSRIAYLTAAVASAALTACSSDSQQMTDEQYKQQIVAGMQTSLLTDINALLQASKDVQTAAPTHAWNATIDGAAIDKMKEAWTRARTAYEHVEGALAPIFPDLDASIDERYDGFLEVGPDDYLFDGMGVTGLHAVERILYSAAIPAEVITFESGLAGYKAAAFPATDQEAADFKNKLVARMIADAQEFHDDWVPTKIPIGDAFKGLIDLMNEQREKVNNAFGGHEESRYSQRTMADLRDNLAGTTMIYSIFRPWLLTKGGSPSGMETDQAIQAGFTQLDNLYKTVPGDALPPAPVTWDPNNPSAADLGTQFGQLYKQVRDAVDPMQSGSIVGRMNAAAGLMGLPSFTKE